MLFEFTEDQLDLQSAIREVVNKECSAAVLRAASEEGLDTTRKQLIETYNSLDWPGLVIPEEFGGIGLGAVEQAILAESLGYAADPTSFLATTTQFAALVQACGDDVQRKEILGGVASGTITGSLAAQSKSTAVDASHAPFTATKSGDSWTLNGTARFVLTGGLVDNFVVIASSADGPIAFVIKASDASIYPVETFDPLLDLADVTLSNLKVDDSTRLANSNEQTINQGLQHAIVMLAASTVGTCQRIFEITLDYVKQRHQFGVPIGSFQAVKHKMANMYVTVERARAVTYFGALTIAEDDQRRQIAASMAKVAAGDAQRLCGLDGIQLFGGIGFTWENDQQFFVKRAKVGELMLGNSNHHRREVARLALV